MLTMASVHQSDSEWSGQTGVPTPKRIWSTYKVGDVVARNGEYVDGQPKMVGKIVRLVPTGTGCRMDAKVMWQNPRFGETEGRHGMTSLHKVEGVKKTAADAPKGFKVVPPYAREREAWGFPAPKRMLSCTKCHKRMWDVYDNASKHRNSHLPAGHPDKIIGT